MTRLDDPENLDRQISVLAGLIAQYRTRIEQMQTDGRNADGAVSALEALGEVYRRRLVKRLNLRAGTTNRQRPASR